MAKCKIGCDFISEGNCCITCNYGKELDSYDGRGVLYSRRGTAQTSIQCSGSCGLLQNFPNGFSHTDCDKCSTYDITKYQYYAIPEWIYNRGFLPLAIKHQKVYKKGDDIIVYLNTELKGVKLFLNRHNPVQLDKTKMQ